MLFEKTSRGVRSRLVTKAPTFLSVGLSQVLAVLLVLAGSLWLASCAPFQTLHQTYIYKGPSGLSDNVTSQNTIAVRWQPQAGPQVAASQPDPIFLKAELIGPFLSIDALLHAVKQSAINGSFDGKPVATAAPTLKVDTWTNRTLTSYVPVPSTLKPGCYDLYYTVTVQANNGSTSTRSDAPMKIHLPDNASCDGTIQSAIAP